MAKRVFSLKFWRRAVTVHGFRGVARAGLRSIRPGTSDPRSSPEHLDLVDRTDDPIEAMYLGIESGRAPLILYPMERLRVEDLGIRIDDTEGNPYTRTVAEYLSGEQTTAAGSALQQHLRDWQPETVAELLGLRQAAAGSVLAEEPTPGLLPWTRPATAAEIAERRAAEERSWALRFGPAPEGAHGSTLYGPASNAVVRYRFDKHVKVADSIQTATRGADRSDPHWWDPERGGFIEVQLLVDGETTTGIVREGKHRSAALAALGTDRILISLPARYPVVRREEVGSWPAVRAGVFSAAEALAVFDRFMAGSAPWNVGSTQARAAFDFS